MSSFLRILAVCGCAVVGASSAHAFSLLGTSEPYTEAEALGHEGSENFGKLPGFNNWVKNLDDEYRWNTRVLYYTYDPEFISYFGSNGIVALDAAISIFNGLTNVSSYSSNLLEFPLDARRNNYTAAALGLVDLKSYALSALVEQYGLGDPDYFTWTLLNRALPPGAQCPQYDYNVVQRNFDPITLSPTAYVNGNLFTYYILELCPQPININQADALEVLVDPLGTFGSAVASYSGSYGDYWTGFTRDDVGGVRYLLQTNNVNWEVSPADAFFFATNQTQVLLYTSNLQVFAEQSLTNDAGALQALYPGLVVVGTSNFFINEVTSNAFAYFTNPPLAPVGSPPVLVVSTNYTTNVATRFVHTFNNVVTNAAYPYCLQSLLTTNIAPSTFAPPGSGISTTNVTLQTTVDTNCVSGSFYILPTNLCAYHVLYTQLTQVVLTTNFLSNTFVTNIVSSTNASGSNVVDYYEFSISELDYFTNNILVAQPVTCPDQVTTLFQGVEKVTFVRRDYDSLLGVFFEPVTNDFTMVEVTNNTRVTRYGRRTVATPDLLFSAAVLAPAPTAWPIGLVSGAVTTPGYITASNVNVLGPGTIQPAVGITFNKVGNVLYNQGPTFITEGSAILEYFHWGSFDGSTNAPIVYPVGSDLLSLENQAVLQVTQPNVVTNGMLQLPDGSVGAAYGGAGFQLEAIGGQTPYTWSGSSGLPPGLLFSPPGSGLITGTPTVAGVYDFVIRLTELGGRHVDIPMTLTINP